jgi:DNA-binding transcriptional regulator YiaG
MTDIVELAKERRARLLAEMAKLEDFIQMAEMLMNAGEDDGLDMRPKSEGFDFGDELLLGTDQFLLVDAPPDDGGEDDELLLTDAVTDGDAKLDAHVGMRIRHRRWMMGIDQQELARLAGLTVGQVQRFESGDSRASARQMREIAAAMKVPLSFFTEGLIDEQPPAEESRDGLRPDQ